MPAGTLRETQSASRVGLESDVKALFVGGLRGVGHSAGLGRVADDNDLVKRCGQLVLIGLVRPVTERHDDNVGIHADGLAAGELLKRNGPLADARERVLRSCSANCGCLTVLTAMIGTLTWLLMALTKPLLQPSGL